MVLVTSNPCKPWFDDHCKKLRQDYYKSRNVYRRNKCDMNKECMIVNCKKYKREISKQFKDFNQQIAQKIRSLKYLDPKSYWNLLNKYSGGGIFLHKMSMNCSL